MTPERMAEIEAAIAKLKAAEQKRVASLPFVLEALAKEAPKWPSAEVMATYERKKSR